MSALALFLINEAYKELPGCEDLHCLRIGVWFFCFIRARIHVWVVLDRVTSTLSWCRCRRAARRHWAGNLGQERHWRKGSSPHILLFHLKQQKKQVTLWNSLSWTDMEFNLLSPVSEAAAHARSRVRYGVSRCHVKLLHALACGKISSAGRFILFLDLTTLVSMTTNLAAGVYFHSFGLHGVFFQTEFWDFRGKKSSVWSILS